MPISIGAMFFAFAFTTVVAGIHQKLRTPSWLVGVLTPVFAAAFVLAAKAMPFAGIVTEIPLVLLATLGASGPVTLMMRANLKIQAAREAEKKNGHVVKMKGTPERPAAKPPAEGVIAMVLFLPVMAATLMTLVTRINYACWLRWECDGRIASVTRHAGNHNSPMILVETDGRTESFDQVDDAMWRQAKPGMTLKKDAGSPRAWLDGRLVRMVPEQMTWWNDPK